MESSASGAAPATARPNEVEAPSENGIGEELLDLEGRQQSVARARLLWDQRRFLARVVLAGLLFGTAIAFLIPKRYESSTQLMPPDNQSGSGMAMLAGLTARTGNGLGM
ncbi:MAG TPA: Wzz/FepE/Etk N-terminal domain-containing protein, partial [Candidatus Acidoferrales bacterium]